LISRFITQNLFWFIILFVYLNTLIYKTMSVEIDCKKTHLLLAVFISSVAIIYVVILISAKTPWFL
jgi:hypothetical protein